MVAVPSYDRCDPITCKEDVLCISRLTTGAVLVSVVNKGSVAKVPYEVPHFRIPYFLPDVVKDFNQIHFALYE